MLRLQRSECEQESFGVRHIRADEVREAAEPKMKSPAHEGVLEQLRRIRAALADQDLATPFEECSNRRTLDSEHLRLRLSR